MGQATNIPGQLLNSLISTRAEISLLIASGIVLILLTVFLNGNPEKRSWFKVQLNSFFGEGNNANEINSLRVLATRVLGFFWIVDGLLQGQGEMPRKFIPMVVEPTLSSQPQWVSSLGQLTINIWSNNTVGTDAFTFFIQIFIGVSLVAGARNWIGKLGLFISIPWAIIIWALGEGFGSLFAPGGTWLVGTPGSALFYAFGAVTIIFTRDNFWRDKLSLSRIKKILGIMFITLAGVEALPFEGFWGTNALGQIFQNSASNSQPSWLSWPSAHLSTFSFLHPNTVNLAFIIVTCVIGIILIWVKSVRLWAIPTGIYLFATWWLGMDFGVLGGNGTDPNSAPLVAFFLFIGYLISGEGIKVSDFDKSTTGIDKGKGRIPNFKVPKIGVLCGVWLATSSLIGVLWTGLPVLVELPSAASTPNVESQALVDSGGLAPITTPFPAPPIHLINQFGQNVSLSDFSKKVVILSFLDPLCYETCPVVAAELAQVAQLMRSRANEVEFVAINANPDFTSSAVVNSFDREHGLEGLKNWQFLTGAEKQLKIVWSAYGAVTLVPQVGMVAHSLLLYFIAPNGNEVEITEATGNPGLSLENSYGAMFANEVGRLLPHG